MCVIMCIHTYTTHKFKYIYTNFYWFFSHPIHPDGSFPSLPLLPVPLPPVSPKSTLPSSPPPRKAQDTIRPGTSPQNEVILMSKYSYGDCSIKYVFRKSIAFSRAKHCIVMLLEREFQYSQKSFSHEMKWIWVVNHTMLVFVLWYYQYIPSGVPQWKPFTNLGCGFSLRWRMG